MVCTRPMRKPSRIPETRHSTPSLVGDLGVLPPMHHPPGRGVQTGAANTLGVVQLGPPDAPDQAAGFGKIVEPKVIVLKCR